mmetsp:Transcript_3959/g.9022  ORF Transcript_3959/g.9022 Transcript_3959/m.9022 type:complete len:118 (+) Transcript_3959:286-639(+)
MHLYEHSVRSMSCIPLHVLFSHSVRRFRISRSAVPLLPAPPLLGAASPTGNIRERTARAASIEPQRGPIFQNALNCIFRSPASSAPTDTLHCAHTLTPTIFLNAKRKADAPLCVTDI